MKPIIPHTLHRWVGIGLFLIGLIATIIALNIPALRSAIQDLEHSGYFGSIIVGVMYAMSLTSATATVVFANIPDTLHPVLIAVCGGLGATLFDLSVFTLTRRDGFRQRMTNWMGHLTHHQSMPRWLSLTLGALLIASPLPDELGATFFGFTAMPLLPFLALSFALNAAGILIITGIF